jgi:hypothetical protein
MTLDLTDEETAALLGELDGVIDNDRYPFSPRIRTLTAIRDKIRPEPVREPMPPLRHYAPPPAGRRRSGEGRTGTADDVRRRRCRGRPHHRVVQGLPASDRA